MASRILITILFLMLLAGCATRGATTPAQPVETNRPAQSHSLTETPSSGAQVTETLVVPGAADTQAPIDGPTATEPMIPTATLITSTPESWSGWIAFIGQDGNLRLLNPVNGKEQQITEDAAPPISGQASNQTEITYSSPKWSSYGNRLAFMRQVGTPIETGYQYEINLMVYDFATGKSSVLVADQQITGFDWRPDSNLIAYGLPIDQNYFLNQDPSLASGINGVQADTGEITTLVEPGRGFPLVGPRWSPDGRYLAFEEVQYMEGRGLFAFYDFETQEYLPWEQVIGSYSWSPNSKDLAFDRLAYIPTGEERIYLSDLRGENVEPLSPEIDQGYAFSPAFSPQGDRLAYFVEVGDLANSQYKLYLIPVSGGEPQELGNFEQPQGINWFADGKSLLLSTGPFEAMKIVKVAVEDGASEVLTEGSQPAIQPVTQ